MFGRNILKIALASFLTCQTTIQLGSAAAVVLSHSATDLALHSKPGPDLARPSTDVSTRDPNTDTVLRRASDTVVATLITSNFAIAAGYCAVTGVRWPACLGVAISVIVLNYLTAWVTGNLGNRDLPDVSYVLNVHDDWLPTTNCGSFCMVKASTEASVWTPYSNTIYNGIYHDIHFIHAENNTYGLRAWQGGYPGDEIAAKLLAARQISYDYYGAVVDFYFVNGQEATWPEFRTNDGSATDGDVAYFIGDYFANFVVTNSAVVFCANFGDSLGEVDLGLWTAWSGSPYIENYGDVIDEIEQCAQYGYK